MTESLLLALLGSVSDLVFAWLGIKALVLISPRDLVSLQSVGLNLTVLGWTLGVSLLTGIIFGLAPALHVSRLNLNDSLKEGGKSESAQASGSRRLRSALVVSEIALAVVLLASAGLLIRSFIRLQQVDRGFDTDNMLTMVIRLPDARYREDRAVRKFFQPGARTCAAPCRQCVRPAWSTICRCTADSVRATGFKIRGPARAAAGTRTKHRRARCRCRLFSDDGNSFVARPQLLRQRTKRTEARDPDQRSTRAQALSRTRIRLDDDSTSRCLRSRTPAEIIGVVGNVRYDSLIDESPPAVYFPHPDLAYSFMTLVVRTDGDPAAIAPAVQREIRALDPNQPVSDVRTMNQVMSEWVARSRFNTLLLGLFAGLATLFQRSEYLE